MPFRYKVNILAELKQVGYTTTRIRKEQLMSESTLQNFRENRMVSWATLGELCEMLRCQPGDLVEYVFEEDAETGRVSIEKV